MGRGRAKAKQAKVARRLKYHSGGTDLTRLAEELGASTPEDRPPNGERFEDEDIDDVDDVDDVDEDLYARYAEKYNDEAEEDEDDDVASSPGSVRASEAPAPRPHANGSTRPDA